MAGPFDVRARVPVLILCASVFLSGCSVTRILGVDFNEYPSSTTDEAFAGDIPGLPDGDRIEGHPFINESLGITPNGPAGSGNNLRLLDLSPPGVFRPALISFAVTEHDVPGEYRIVWEGATQGPLHHTDVLFLDTNGNEAIRLTFIDQSSGSSQAILFFTGGSSVTPIPISANTIHEVLVVIRPGENEVDVRYESAGDVITRENLPMSSSSFNKLGFVRFAVLKADSAYHVAHLNAATKN